MDGNNNNRFSSIKSIQGICLHRRETTNLKMALLFPNTLNSLIETLLVGVVGRGLPVPQ